MHFKKLPRLLRQKRHIKTVLCIRLSVLRFFHVTFNKIGDVYFRSLGMNSFQDLLLWARVVVRTSNMEISPRL